ncbi:undecaprenyl-diphosphatase [Gracilibacillus ureilyticus]|uniref:Undecaprenyl-diphosphatase n=1 Tax=Gracilibacillus ureilyticus TaxID=531814 RepID=A0A1H9UTF2_9BACI|nr:phosphatase PAP2 family protein [Gracilibacillus ureilyticus]SES12800.1 undecaprenyl-diphosphatase [Gracilibacillus ureilyticus]
MLETLRKVKNIPKVSLIILVTGFIIIAISMALFVELAEDVAEKEKFTVDTAVQNIMVNFSDTFLYTFMGYITEAGSVLFVTVASAMLFIYLLFFSRKSKWIAVFFAINMIGISGLTKLLKIFFERERPELLEQYDGTGFSFPSGHATGSMTFYGFLVYLIAVSKLKKCLKIILISLSSLLILSIALSRVVLSVHFFTDIIAGLALGLSWLIISIFAMKLMMYREKKRKEKIQPGHGV